MCTLYLDISISIIYSHWWGPCSADIYIYIDVSLYLYPCGGVSALYLWRPVGDAEARLRGRGCEAEPGPGGGGQLALHAEAGAGAGGGHQARPGGHWPRPQSALLLSASYSASFLIFWF